MAITYTPMAVTTQASNAAALADYVAKMNTALTANSAWSQVSNLTNVGSQAWSYMAWKCDHTVSGLTQDFYVIAAYQTTFLYIYIAESWSATQVADVQTITLTGAPTGGTFTLSTQSPVTGAPFTTATIAFNATAATVQTALQSLYGAGNVTVTGNAGGPWTVTLSGAYQAAPAFTVGANSLTGGSTPGVQVAHTTVGSFAAQASGLAPAGYTTQYVNSAGLASGAFNGAQLPLFAASPTTGSPTGYYGSSWSGGGSYSGFSTNVNSANIGTSIYYHFAVYADHVVIGIGPNSTTVKYYYFGAMTSLVANPGTNDPFCIGQISLSVANSSASSSVFSCTRVPLSLTTMVGQNALSYWAGMGPYNNWLSGTWLERPGANHANSFGQGSPFFDALANGYQLSRAFVPQPVSANSTQPSTYLGFRAAPNNLLASASGPTGIAQGDTISYNGTSWVWLGLVFGFNVYVDTGS